jgi:formate dehydrogenase maturation protein FdhE
MDRVDYIQVFASRIRFWDEQTDRLREKAEKAPVEHRLAFRQKMLELQEKRTEATDLLAKLREAGEDDWYALKTRADTLMTEEDFLGRRAA